MSIQHYFDLTQPATFSDPRPKGSETRSRSLDTDQKLSLKWQIVTYAVLVLSIMASRFLDLFRAGVASSFRIDLPYLIFIAIASLLVFPVVYDKAFFTSFEKNVGKPNCKFESLKTRSPRWKV